MWQTFGYFLHTFTLVAVIKNTTFRFWLHRKRRKTVSIKFPFSVTKAHACIQNVSGSTLPWSPRFYFPRRTNAAITAKVRITTMAALWRPRRRCHVHRCALPELLPMQPCTAGVRVSISGRLIRRHASACDTALLSTLLAWRDVKIRRCSSYICSTQRQGD